MALKSTIYSKGRKPMALKPDVTLLMTASGSFDDEHKPAHTKKKICSQKISKVKAIFLDIITFIRRKPRN